MPWTQRVYLTPPLWGLFCGLSLWLVLFQARGAGDERPPNFVFILADDLGYGELGSYGQEKIRTPHLDRLARQGMRLTQHYAGAPVCAPARCVLLTGQHLARAQVRDNRDSGRGGPFPGQRPLSADTVTWARILQQAGYRTGGFGKWGLGPTDSSGSPLNQGFDRFFGYNCQRNAHSYFPPFLDDDRLQLTLNERPIHAYAKQPEGEVRAEDYRSDHYAPDWIVREALRFLEQNHDAPFLLYLPFVEPHLAMHPPQRWIDAYPPAWDAELGPYRGQNGYLPHPRPRAAYAAMISHLDDHVAQILQRLEDLGISDNTMVVFTSDNGPTHGGQDANFSAGGASCKFFNSNGGLRGYKGSCYEGGLRVPCIVRWPGRIPAGTSSDFASYAPDWFPTLCQAADLAPPAGVELDGISLLHTLCGRGEEQPAREQPLVWEFHGYGGIVAVRQGPWKAIRRQLKTDRPADWELYDLDADPQELRDVAAEHPERCRQLQALYEAQRRAHPLFRWPADDAPPGGRE